MRVVDERLRESATMPRNNAANDARTRGFASSSK
jgi:hypothetical protein